MEIANTSGFLLWDFCNNYSVPDLFETLTQTNEVQVISAFIFWLSSFGSFNDSFNLDSHKFR